MYKTAIGEGKEAGNSKAKQVAQKRQPPSQTHLVNSPPAFVQRDFLRRGGLDLDQVQRLGGNRDGGLQDGLHLAELACVARHKVDGVAGGHGGLRFMRAGGSTARQCNVGGAETMLRSLLCLGMTERP